MQRAFLAVVVACACIASSRTHAQGAAEGYEASRIEAALTEAGLELDPAPADKRIAFIRLVQQDVFIPEEPWPVWPNALHTLTRPAVIEREYLFAVGEVFNAVRIEETERNLRTMGIFALARIVAVKASDPTQVGLLVHTRDLWSLRTEWDLQATGLSVPDVLFTALPLFVVHNATMPWRPRGLDVGDVVVDRLLLQGTERNLAGYGKVVIARLQANPIVYSVGEVLQDRRLFLGEHRLDQSFDLFFNRRSGRAEGSQGRLLVWKPFYNLAQTVSYSIDAQYITKIARVLRTGDVATYDVPDTDVVEAIPRIWNERSGAMVASAGYRYGGRFKQLFTVGAGYRDRSVQPLSEAVFESGQRDSFRRDVLPRVRRELFPSIKLELIEARFVTYQDLGSFGLSENVRVGPSVSIGSTLPLRAFGSSTDSATLALSAGYVAPLSGGGLLEASGNASGRYERGVLINQQLSLQARGATPFMFAGRLVFRTLWDGRRDDTENTPVSLGGDNGLRGYPSQALIGFGASRILSSVEYRTRPVSWRSAQLGFVLFYDAGTVYDSLRSARMHYAIGTGTRLLFPQFDRYTFRFDVAVPVGEPGFQLLATFGSAQAVPLTAIEDELAAGTF